MKNANYTIVRSVFAKFAAVTVAPLLISGAMIATTGCSNDDGVSTVATIDAEKENAHANVPVPKEYPEETTIEMTGNAGLDIVDFNEQVSYTFNARPGAGRMLARTAADAIADNVFGDAPYKKYAERILDGGERWLDKTFDVPTFGMWSGIKNALVLWLFPGQEDDFNIREAFDEVNRHLANIEAILQEMRVEVENGMKVQTYAQRLTDRKDLYSVLKSGIEELNNRIISINNDTSTTDEEKYAEVKDAVRQWGEESVGTASAVMPARQQAKNLIEKITTSVQLPDAGGYVSDYMRIYDEYAKRTLLWEQDGYAWRELMRAQDAKMVMQLAVASVLYYSIVKENRPEIDNLRMQISNYLELVRNTPVVRHSTPIYIKYGSKWSGQVFTGVLKEMNYANILKNKNWSAGSERRVKNENLKYILKEENYRYNASRLYGGYAPAHPDKPKTDYEPSTKLAMPEEWYRELYDAYAASGKRRSLMEIFKNQGFTYRSKPIEIKPFQSNKFEQFFITSRRSYTRVFKASEEQYYMAISVVAGNSDASLNTGMVQDHEAYALRYQATKTYSVIRSGKHSKRSYSTDSNRMFYKLLSDYSPYRAFIYLEKTDKAVEVK